MPRGRNKAALSLAEQIVQFEAEIASHKEAIKELNNKLKAAKTAKEKEDMERLSAAIAAKGMTIEEITEALEKGSLFTENK